MKITRGTVPMGKKVVLYGVEGIGKSTLAAQFPNAVFIDTEGSTANYDLARFPTPTSWEMVKQCAEYAQQHPDEVGTLVIDTADWAERLCKQSLCQKNNWTSIETPSYGVGYTQAAEEFGRLLDILDRCIKRGIHVVVTAHATVKRVELPTEFGSFDKYELKCSKQVSPLLKEWCDLMLFLNYKMTIVTEKGKQSGKAQGGQRTMYATKHPAYDAKNRFGLPDEMPMDYGYIAHLFGNAAAVPSQSASLTALPEGEPRTSCDNRNAPASPSGRGADQREAERAYPAISAREEYQVQAEEDNASLPNEEPIDPLTGRSLYEGIYPPMADLLRSEGITPMELTLCVEDRLPGCFPANMPVRDYPQDFFEQWAMPNWPHIVEWVRKDRENLPF